MKLLKHSKCFENYLFLAHEANQCLWSMLEWTDERWEIRIIYLQLGQSLDGLQGPQDP